MPCFCFCPDLIKDGPKHLPLLAAWLLQAAKVTWPPSSSSARNIATGGNSALLKIKGPKANLNVGALRFLTASQLSRANSSRSARLTASAQMALHATSSIDLPTAHLKLQKIAKSTNSFVLPFASKLALLPPEALARLALAAQLIQTLIDQGLSPYSGGYGSRYSRSSRRRGSGPLASFEAPSVNASTPILSIVSMTKKRGRDPHNAADLRLTGQHLAKFGASNVGLKYDAKATMKIVAALNVVAQLEATFGESLFLADPAAWRRVIEKLKQFTNASSQRRSRTRQRRGGSGSSSPLISIKSPSARLALGGIQLTDTQRGWLRSARRSSVRAAFNASLRASASLRGSAFLKTEATIGLVYALSAALGTKPTSKCCGRCGPPIPPIPKFSLGGFGF